MDDKPVKQFDIIITGAGPAGCAAALSLKEPGLQVALIDKSVYPRDKVCGDAIPGRAVKMLEALSPDLAAAFAGYDKQLRTRRTSVVYNNKALKLHWNTLAYTCPRLHFDNWLLQQVKKTRTAIFEGTRITAVEQTGEAIVLKDNKGNVYKTRLLIGADGAQSVAAKSLAGRTIDRDHHIGAVRAYYSGVGDVAADHIEMHIDRRFLPGYFWIFPVADGKVNAGFGMISSDIVKNKINLKKAFPDFIEAMPALRRRFAGATLEGDIEGFSLPLGSRKVTMSGHRYMLAGDAASLIDPISGEGIGNAMFSGRQAALHALQCFKHNDFSAAYMQQYDDAVWSELGKELTLHYRGQKLLRRMPGLLDMIFSLARYEPVRRYLQTKF